jgi:hypothetical protein
MATTATIKSQSAWPDGQIQYAIAYVTDAGDVVERRGSVPTGTNLQAMANATLKDAQQAQRRSLDTLESRVQHTSH